MRYTTHNGIYIAEVPVRDFKVVMVDQRKKNTGKTNVCNAGFFQNFDEGKTSFTLPVGHVVADFAAACSWVEHYCKVRGSVANGKVSFDSGSWDYMNQFKDKKVSTLSVINGKARIDELLHLLPNTDYAIAGVPIMRDGNDVKYATFVRGQGWFGSELYGTWHNFLGLKAESADTIYVMAMKTTTGNMVSSAEAYKKFKPLGFRDVIKLDGGGSFYFNAAGKTLQTSENRRVNTIIEFGALETKPAAQDGSKNPYKEPTGAIKYGSGSKESVKWLQWELNRHGYACDIDGSFGPATDRLLRKFQKDHGLAVDGSCGPATRAALKK